MSEKNKAFMRKIMIGFLFFMTISFAFAANKMPLPDSEAFELSVDVDRNHVINANFKMAPGYYLYREKLSFSVNPTMQMKVNLPDGVIKYRNDQQPYEVYFDKLNIPVSFPSNTNAAKLMIEYQGCSSGGFCYPPMKSVFNVNFQNQTINGVLKIKEQNISSKNPDITSHKSLLKDQFGIQSTLNEQHPVITLLLFIGLGLLLAFTPCVLPMIPILASIIVGQKQTSDRKSKIFFLSLSYVLGTAIAYAMAGLLAAAMGNSLQLFLQKPIFIYFASITFVVLSLSLFDFYQLQMPNSILTRLTSFSNKREGGTYISVFLMGVISSLIVSPCVTAPLVGVLMYIGQTGNLLFGASALFAMGIGMGIPLLIIGLSAGQYLPKRGPWMESIKKLFGLMMLAMAIWLMSRIISPLVLKICVSIWLLLITYYFAITLPKLIGKPIINRAIAIVAGTAGLLLFISALGFHNPIGEILNRQYVKNENLFTVVKNVNELNNQLSLAKKSHQSVILDFYADWCESCVAMDKNVFNQTNVKIAEKKYVLLRADLTNNNNEDEILLKTYGVIAPPTILFFNEKGQEISSKRIVGEVNADEFLSHLSSLS